MEYQAADNRPQTKVDSPRQVDLDFKPCIVWLLARKHIITSRKFVLNFNPPKYLDRFLKRREKAGAFLFSLRRHLTSQFWPWFLNLVAFLCASSCPASPEAGPKTRISATVQNFFSRRDSRRIGVALDDVADFYFTHSAP